VKTEALKAVQITLHEGLNLAKTKVGGMELTALVGPAAFYIGLVIVLVAAFIEPSDWLFVSLGVLGVIVGILNITARQTGPFLLATIAFIVAAFGMYSLVTIAGSTATPVVTIPTELIRLAATLTVFMGAAAMVIALRAIYEAAKSR